LRLWLRNIGRKFLLEEKTQTPFGPLEKLFKLKSEVVRDYKGVGSFEFKPQYGSWNLEQTFERLLQNVNSVGFV